MVLFDFNLLSYTLDWPNSLPLSNSNLEPHLARKPWQRPFIGLVLLRLNCSTQRHTVQSETISNYNRKPHQSTVEYQDHHSITYTLPTGLGPELRKASSFPSSADITTMTHLNNLIQTLGLRLRFCPTQPRCQLRRVVASSSSCRTSKQSSRFYNSKTLTTTKTDDINISATAPHNLIIVTLPATALLLLVINSFALAQDTAALSTNTI